MTTNIIHRCFGIFSASIVWVGLAVSAAVAALLLVSEGSSGVRPPGCQRGEGIRKRVR
jgi:hypothetical protein